MYFFKGTVLVTSLSIPPVMECMFDINADFTMVVIGIFITSIPTSKVKVGDVMNFTSVAVVVGITSQPLPTFKLVCNVISISKLVDFSMDGQMVHGSTLYLAQISRGK